jgi:hypothetical protein
LLLYGFVLFFSLLLLRGINGLGLIQSVALFVE